MARLVSRLRVIADGADDAVALALHDTAAFILTLIRVYVPVKTGWLRDSYKKDSLGLLHILVGTMVNYSIFQEYGTSRMSARPHVTPAFVQAEPYFRQQFERRVDDLG
jgi:HK97 gp10 family phage protein